MRHVQREGDVLPVREKVLPAACGQGRYRFR